MDKERWIADYIFYSGHKWSDPPCSREEAERAWDDRQRPKFFCGPKLAKFLRDNPDALAECGFAGMEVVETQPIPTR